MLSIIINSIKTYWAYHGRHCNSGTQDRPNSCAHGSFNELSHKIKIAMCGPHICLPHPGLWIPRLTYGNKTMIVKRTGKKTSLEQSKVKGERQGIGVKLGKLPKEGIAWFS